MRKALHKNLDYFKSPVKIGNKTFDTKKLRKDHPNELPADNAFALAGTKFLKEELKSIIRFGGRLVECLDCPSVWIHVREMCCGCIHAIVCMHCSV